MTEAVKANGPVVVGQLRQHVAGEVRAWMARRQMTQDQLAAAMGVSQAYISRRLGARTAFDMDDMEGISRVLRVPVTHLMSGPGGSANGGTHAAIGTFQSGDDTGATTVWYLRGSRQPRAALHPVRACGRSYRGVDRINGSSRSRPVHGAAPVAHPGASRRMNCAHSA